MRAVITVVGKDKTGNGNSVVFASVVTIPYKVVFNVDEEYLTAFSTENFTIENRTHAGKPLLRGKHNISGAYIYNDKPING